MIIVRHNSILIFFNISHIVVRNIKGTKEQTSHCASISAGCFGSDLHPFFFCGYCAKTNTRTRLRKLLRPNPSQNHWKISLHALTGVQNFPVDLAHVPVHDGSLIDFSSFLSLLGLSSNLTKPSHFCPDPIAVPEISRQFPASFQ